MNKLPVVLLKGLILFPFSEARIELTRKVNLDATLDSIKNYSDRVMVMFQEDVNEENPSPDGLFHVGVEAFIKTKSDINGKQTRVVLQGVTRKKIVNIDIKNNIFYAEYEDELDIFVNPKEEIALARRLMYKLQTYVNNAPYLSNTILSKIPTDTNIEELSDLVSFFLPNTIERKKEYIEVFDPVLRMQMLIKDIDREQEILELERKIDNKLHEQLSETQKQFVLREKMKLIKEELGEDTAKDKEIENINKKLKSRKIPSRIKERVKEELKKYEMLPTISNESGILKTYIDYLISMPWRQSTTDEEDLNKVKRYLNKTHYGLDKIKTRIIEYIAAKQLSKNLNAPIICLVGPPGTGKTTLAYSIAKALNKKFVKVNMSGISDESEIMGHRKTYVGAMPGRIIKGINKAGSSNPLFLIDEIDKVGKDIKGDPANALLEILDPSQNSHFSDHYLEEEYDLSKVMFVATANYLDDIPLALFDRLEIIELNGYTELEKISIAKNHLIPNTLEEYGFNKNSIKFDKDVIKFIIKSYTKEAGVRELNRLIQTIVRKVATDIVVKNKKEVETIITLSKTKKYLGIEKFLPENHVNKDKVGLVNGLAYTSYGGSVLPIEVAMYDGKGELKLTGSLGDIMKESATIAYSYVKANSSLFGVNKDLFDNKDIHIHVPEGAVPKEGPSAGVALTTAIISVMTKRKVDLSVGMTGEITLRGDVLPIGGLKEKAIGAYNGNLKTIYIPKANKKDVYDIPSEIKKNLNIVFVSNYKNIVNKILK